MNKMLTAIKKDNNISLTENGAVTYVSTFNKVLDMFAMGGAYRSRSDEDCILLFKNAYEENPELAMKCLFYLRDCRGGQGERRFFRVVARWMAIYEQDAIRRNMKHILRFGRWDDLYIFVDTPLEKKAFQIMYEQLALDVSCKTPSLLAKWLKSENTSSKESKKLGKKTREAFKMTPRQYRKTLSYLRKKINVLERLMSENRWDEIEFDKIPSRAGIIYRNAFARRDIIKARYEAFAKDNTTRVNADVLYPHDIAHRAFKSGHLPLLNAERLMLQKYWDNLPNYYGDKQENGIAVVDVSGSMCGVPLEAAVSMGAYIAEKAHGPFANHFITFSAAPELVEFKGADITDKFHRCIGSAWQMNTNIEAVFNLLLKIAIKTNCSTEDMPERIYIFSDMEFDACMVAYNPISGNRNLRVDGIKTLMEEISKEWATLGYKLPSVIFWNLNARHNNIPAIGSGFSYVSGFSPVMIETILSGKDGIDLMLEKLNSERYSVIS